MFFSDNIQNTIDLSLKWLTNDFLSIFTNIQKIDSNIEIQRQVFRFRDD